MSFREPRRTNGQSQTNMSPQLLRSLGIKYGLSFLYTYGRFESKLKRIIVEKLIFSTFLNVLTSE